MRTDRDVLGEIVNAVGQRTMPPKEDYDRVLAAARNAWQQKTRSRRRRRWVFALAAMLSIFAMGMATFVHWAALRTPSVTVASVTVLRGNASVRSPREKVWESLGVGAHIIAGSTLRTGAAAGLALELSGPVSVRLDKLSELEIESTHALRLISGKLFVDSGPTHAPGSLRVATNIGTVYDIGTVFEVQAVADAVRVRVREGRVQLDAASSRVRLESAAGEELELNKRGTVRRGAFPATHADWAWAEALTVVPIVEGHSLLQFLDWVAHESGRRLQFQGPEVEAQAREVILHGRTRDLPPLEALDLMLSTTDLEYALPTDGLIVISKRQE